MPQYAKVEKATGDILEIRELPADSKFAANKPVEWLPLIDDAAPAFDPATERLESSTTVNPGVSVTRSQVIVPLGVVELAEIKRGKIAVLDTVMAYAAEVIANKLIAQGVIATTDLPQEVLDALKTRTALRV